MSITAQEQWTRTMRLAASMIVIVLLCDEPIALARSVLAPAAPGARGSGAAIAGGY